MSLDSVKFSSAPSSQAIHAPSPQVGDGFFYCKAAWYMI